MPKEEREFFHHQEVNWTQVSAGSGAAGEGIEEKVLSRDEATGECTRLLRFALGAETSQVLAHDFWEEVIILEGELHDKTLNKTFTSGMYACRPPGMPHGPYAAPRGCVTFEVRYHSCR